MLWGEREREEREGERERRARYAAAAAGGSPQVKKRERRGGGEGCSEGRGGCGVELIFAAGGDPILVFMLSANQDSPRRHSHGAVDNAHL